MQDRPTAVELLEAIREFLEQDVMPAVEGRVQFHTRVAVNALGMLERELRLGPELAAAERARLGALLGHDADLDALEERGGDQHAIDEVVHRRFSPGERRLVANDEESAEGHLPAAGGLFLQPSCRPCVR